MPENIIKIEKKYVVFRHEARDISKAIQKRAEQENIKTIYLNFLNVTFFSRSFLDELLNIINFLQKKKLIIKITKLKPELKKFLSQVKKRKQEIRKKMVDSSR